MTRKIEKIEDVALDGVVGAGNPAATGLTKVGAGTLSTQPKGDTNDDGHASIVTSSGGSTGRPTKPFP